MSAFCSIEPLSFFVPFVWQEVSKKENDMIKNVGFIGALLLLLTVGGLAKGVVFSTNVHTKHKC
jgi:hypothetical protein